MNKKECSGRLGHGKKDGVSRKRGAEEREKKRKARGERARVRRHLSQRHAN